MAVYRLLGYFSDVYPPVNIVLKYLGEILKAEYELTSVRAELMNYKCICDHRISLSELRPPQTFGDFNVLFTDYNPSRHTAYIIKLSLNGLRATIKLFESGKCNVLGCKSPELVMPLITILNTYLRQGNVLYTS